MPLLCRTPGERDALLGEFMQQGGNGAEITHKPSVEPCKPKKTLNLRNCHRRGPGLDGVNLAAVHLNALQSNNIAKKRNTWCAEVALFQIAK
jgi:hypothetical protein